MKVITELKGTVLPDSQGGFASAHVCSALHDEPVSGFLRHAELGAGGLIFRVPKFLRVGDEPPRLDGYYEVGIPLAELWRLAESTEPGLKAPPPKTQRVILKQVAQMMQ